MTPAVSPADPSPEQLRFASSQTVYFGHQSVGDNIVLGLKEWMAAEPALRLNIIHGETAAGSDPVFVEFYVGENTRPASKDAAFSAAMARGAGARGGIAIYKYCYIDADATTDAAKLFQAYRNNVTSLQRRYPHLRFVHATMPLMRDDYTLKSRIKALLGRTTGRDANARRNEFNDLLRSFYGGKEPIFDVAEIESTRPDGSRSRFEWNGRGYYSLAPEYTEDGGHLNQLGRRVVARKFVATLASL